MNKLQLLDADWPSRAILLETVRDAAADGRWEQVGIVARDQRVVWTENAEGVVLWYEPSPQPQGGARGR